jgi:hypothetical protein
MTRLGLRDCAQLVASDAAREIAVRYLGPEAGEAYASGGSDEIVIRLEPGELRVWDFADEL